MPSACLVYLHLTAMSEITGLSWSSVQKSIRWPFGRKLLRVAKASPTATPEYRVLQTLQRR